MTWTFDFNNPLAVRPEYTGGKGSNLAQLTEGRFDVPQGFIVTAAAYREWIEGVDWWREAVRNLPKDNPAELAVAAEALRGRLQDLPMPEEVCAEIRGLVEAHPGSAAFAVRSSSTLEDMADAAFAGQHDTFLNCRGADAVIAAVHGCYASLWHDRAIAYRQQNGFDHFAAQMAVVVQEMAACNSAGVAFSINPVTGDLGSAVINANQGLGESVVSGACEVDHWEVDKTTGEVRSALIAEKTSFTAAAPDGGIEDQAFSEGEGSIATLSDGEIAAIMDLLKRAESYFRFPQDIEWGFVGERLVLLQSRPITTIPPRWTRDESAERFPNAMTPLTWDFVDKGFHESMEHSFRLMGFPHFSGQWFGKHEHYIYGNQNAVDLYAGQFPFALDSLDDLPVLIPKLRERYRWVQELPVDWSRDLDYYLIRLGEFMAEPLADKSASELWQFVQAVNAHGAQYFKPNIAISVTQGMLYRLLMFLLRELCGAEQAAALMDGLLAFCETKTGAVNRELYELAMLARDDTGLAEKLRAESGTRALWESGDLVTEHPAFHKRFLLMMRNHGHRELDIDLYHPLWAEVPWVALDQIRLILDAPDDLTPAQRERELKIRSQASEFALFQKLPEELHFFVHEIVRLARIYTSLDDLEHYQTTRLAVPLRKGLMALGERFVEQGVMAEPSDLFFAREAEIESAFAENSEEGWRHLSARIAAEKASWLEASASAPPWVPDSGQAAPVQSATATELTGIPGSPGIAEGKVFIVSGPGDFADFPAGAILVARTTNPAWTPLFYSALALITESGGPLSHGAVTAREMGIPAVMSAHGCLGVLSNGCTVRVDGIEGRVALLDD